MADRVPPLKQESAEGDLFPNEFDPNEDAVDVRGVFVQSDTSDDEAVNITRDSSDRMTFKDGDNTTPIPLTDLIGGGAVPPIAAFSGYDSSGGTNIVSGWTDVPLDSERKKTSDFAHTAPSAEVTVSRDDTFIIAATVATDITTGTSRSDSEMRVQIDTGGGYTTVPGTQLVIYNRNSSQGKGAVTKVFVIDLSSGDRVKVQARRLSGGSTIALRAGSELVIATTRGPQGPAGSGGVDEDEGSAVGTFDTLNFTGAGVTATDAGGGVTDITIPGGSAVDEKVKVSANDTTADYLLAKLAAGSRIAITELNDGGNEDAQIAVSDEVQYDEDDTARSTTNETGFDLAQRLTTTALVGGTYRVGWYYTWRQESIADNFQARVQVDGTTVHYHEEEPKEDSAEQRFATAGFAYVTLGAGPINIDLEFSTDDNNDASWIYVSRLEIWRVS